MCNLYNVTTSQQAILDFSKAIRDIVGNMEPSVDIYPDYSAPIVRSGADGARELVKARWGMPSSKKALFDATVKRADRLRAKGKEVDFDQLLRMEPDVGTTNIRNVASQHWKRWLGVESRCIVPATAFSEYGPIRDALGKLPLHWFALDETRPLFFFAGVWTSWTAVRRAKEGEVTADIFAFLTTDPNGLVAPIHPKAMPVILTTGAEVETWLTAPWEDAKALQRPLPEDQLILVERPKVAA